MGMASPKIQLGPARLKLRVRLCPLNQRYTRLYAQYFDSNDYVKFLSIYYSYNELQFIFRETNIIIYVNQLGDYLHLKFRSGIPL